MAVLPGLMLLTASIQPTGATSPTTAAQALPATPVDPDRLAAAQAFIAASDPDTNLRRTVDSTVSTTIQQLRPELERQLAHPLTNDAVGRLETAMREDLMSMYRSIWPGMMRGMADAYARVFTVAELRRATELMRDPVMLRMMETMPEIMQRTFAHVDVVGQLPRMTRMQSVLAELFRSQAGNSPAAH